jgi:rhomboid family GlyGly-CTERM serine protease
MGPLPRSHGTWSWGGLCGLLAFVCISVWLLPVEWQIAMRWHAQSWGHAPWTLWTASLTHLSDMHMWVNVLALVCLAIVGAHTGCGRLEALAVWIAWPLSTSLLLIWPEVQFYAGLSGLNHAIAVIIAMHGTARAVRERKITMMALLLALVLAFKIAWEQAWQAPLRFDASWGFTVVQAAHLTGMMAAVMASTTVCTMAWAIAVVWVYLVCGANTAQTP